MSDMKLWKKTVKKFLTPTDKLDELNTKPNHFDNDPDESRIVSHVVVQVPYIDMTNNNDKDIVVYQPKILKDDSDESLFSCMISKDEVFYLWVRSNYKCTKC